MIDTHCHLDMYDEDREAVIQRARDAGAEALITIGSDPQSNINNLSIAEEHDFVYLSIGIHPHDAKDFTEDICNHLKAWAIGNRQEARGIDAELRTPESELRTNKVVAIGETGLDYHYDHSPRDIQQEVFRRHLSLAKETGLPVIVHSREAKDDTLRILAESGVNKGVLHCFSGDIDMAEKVMGMGFHISIAGPVTFKKAKGLQEIAALIPDNYLLVETDAPFLAPEPLRGKKNEPALVAHTIKKIAELRGVRPEDIDRITTLNAKRLFNIGRLPSKGEIAYRIRDSLYLNITNRCTSRCSFCVKFHSDYVKGHNMRLTDEPSEDELINAIGDPSVYKEVVFCGYGEPLLRLELVKKVAGWIKEHGGHVRINTNGHGNLIHKRNILPELEGIVDILSISLDAQDEETYNSICLPAFKGAYQGVIAFLREAKKHVPDVTATVVSMEGVDVGKCREIAEDLGVRLRVRDLDVVG
ncbi:MAG: TatD family hydrolase [Nitrospirota bacterium]